ncbi:hypothetical protein [Clostridium butyricum]|jgi:hypothetical protein|uniref:hypothetical protein n=1 Tax=Clostridium butyricum TaxID=1492 RepID=UPI00374F39E1
MKLKSGYKIKITRHETNRKTKDKLKMRIGIIVAVNPHIFTVQFKNFKESFRLTEISQHNMEVRVNGDWRRLKLGEA